MKKQSRGEDVPLPCRPDRGFAASGAVRCCGLALAKPVLPVLAYGCQWMQLWMHITQRTADQMVTEHNNRRFRVRPGCIAMV
jgi:hypothetical protein